MASHNRRSKTPIIGILAKEADQFEFHAMVKLLENIQKETTALGEGIDPTKEPVRLQARVSQEFPSTDIHAFLPSHDKQVPPLLTTNFFGIAGHQGPLPEPYTTYIIQRILRHDTAIRDFLDIFNHRLMSILHRIRKKFWIGVSVAQPEYTLLGKCFKSLLGLGIPQLQERLAIPDRSLTYYAGILWQKPRSAEGLAVLLRNFFRTPATITQLQGKWVHVPVAEQTGLGSMHHKLGDSAFVGPRYWDQTAYFLITLGPMSLNQYIEFLKPGPAYKEIKNLITFYSGPTQDFRLNLILDKKQFPHPRLGCGVALGWTSWLNRISNKNEQDDQQCVLTTHALQKIYSKSTLEDLNAES
jgi:type VI secretion system protein ImpH